MRLDALGDVDDGVLGPDVDGGPHHLPGHAVQTAGLDAHGPAVGIGLMQEPAPTPGTEIPVRLAAGIRPAVQGQCAGAGRRDGEGREHGRHPVHGRRLVSALGAVADVDGRWLRCGRREADLTTLAPSFHFREL